MLWVTSKQFSQFDEGHAIWLLMSARPSTTYEEALTYIPQLRSLEQIKRSKGEPFDIELCINKLMGIQELDDVPGKLHVPGTPSPALKYHPPTEASTKTAQLNGEWFIDDSGFASFADGDEGDYNHELVAAQSMIGDEELYERWTEGTLTDEDRETLEVQEPGFLAYMESGGEAKDWVIEKHNWIRVKGSNFELWTMDREALDRIADFVGEQLSEWGDEEDTDVYIEELSTGKYVAYSLSEIDAILQQDQAKEQTMQLRQQQSNDPQAVQLDPTQPGFQPWEPTLWDHQGEDKMMPMAGSKVLRVVSQAKPMPLPFRQNIPEDNLKRPTTMKYDYMMTEDTARAQEAELGDANWLGDGSYNIVYQKGDVAIKYCEDETEVEIYRKQYERKLPCLVKVLEPPREIQEELWQIKMEKVEPLEEEQRRVIAVASQWALTHFRGVEKGNFGSLYSEIKQFVEIYNRNASHRPSWTGLDVDNPVLIAYAKLLICLKSYMMTFPDVHSRNVGWDKNGTLVLFDLGGSSLVPQPDPSGGVGQVV